MVFTDKMILFVLLSKFKFSMENPWRVLVVAHGFIFVVVLFFIVFLELLLCRVLIRDFDNFQWKIRETFLKVVNVA